MMASQAELFGQVAGASRPLARVCISYTASSEHCTLEDTQQVVMPEVMYHMLSRTVYYSMHIIHLSKVGCVALLRSGCHLKQLCAANI